MSKVIAPAIGLIAGLLVAVVSQAQPRNLDIYWVDVEGGAATLVVSPSGESLLYDTGWEVGDRDAKPCTTNGSPGRRASKASGRGTSRCSTENTTPRKT